MHRFRPCGVAAVVLAGIVAGCGSTSSTSSSTASNAAGGGATSTANAGTSTPATGYGAYGQSTSRSATSTSSPATGGAAASSTTAVIATKGSTLGPILAVGPKRLTVYLFEADHGRTSACTGACAKAWPPVTGTPKATGSAMLRDLGTITRSDGSTQITYKGHPLYRFTKDQDSGDAYGEGVVAFGGGWYVLRPTGAKVVRS